MTGKIAFLIPFWKINLFVWNSDICLQKETSYWVSILEEVEDGTKHIKRWQFGKSIEDIPFEKCSVRDGVNPCNAVYVEQQSRPYRPYKDAYIKFTDGGYIKAANPGLEAGYDSWKEECSEQIISFEKKLKERQYNLNNDIPDFAFSTLSLKELMKFQENLSQVEGDNVYSRSIHIEIEMANSPTLDKDSSATLFHYAQGVNGHYIAVNEIHKEDQVRQAKMQISGKEYLSGLYQVDSPNNYMLSVSLDKDIKEIEEELIPQTQTEPKTFNYPYFEFYVDAMGVKNSSHNDSKDKNEGSHLFCLNSQTFYIGYDPDNKTTFDGSIRRLVFDPNGHCGGCPA